VVAETGIDTLSRDFSSGGNQESGESEIGKKFATPGSFSQQLSILIHLRVW